MPPHTPGTKITNNVPLKTRYASSRIVNGIIILFAISLSISNLYVVVEPNKTATYFKIFL